MKKFIPGLSVAAALAMLFVSMMSVTTASAVSVKLIDGTQTELFEGNDNRPVLLKFWATWCSTCMKEMPEFIAMYDKHHSAVRFLAVNVATEDPRPGVISAIEKLKLEMPVVYDEKGELQQLFGVTGTPTYVLLDQGGNLLFRSNRHDTLLESEIEAFTRD